MYEYDLMDYVPDYLKDSEEFRGLVGILQVVANDIKYFVDTFSDLVDIDSVPDVFLPKLSYILSYNNRYDINTPYQRELIKRMILIYKNKGTDDDILMAANNGENDGWLGYKLFYPDHGPTNNSANITYAADNIARWDVSRLSTNQRYADGSTWRYGVLLINVESSSPVLRDAIMKVVPAGVKFIMRVVAEMGKDGEFISFGTWTIDAGVFLKIQPKIINYSDGLKFSTTFMTSGKNKWSGSRSVLPYVTLNIKKYAHMTRPVSEYKGTVTPVSEVMDFLAGDSGINNQWGNSVLQMMNDRSLDAAPIASSLPEPESIDSGHIESDYTRYLDMGNL